MPISRLFLCFLFVGMSAPAVAEPTPRELTLQQRLVESVESPAISPLRVSIWSDREDNTYLLGEAVHLSVRANDAAYFEVIAIDSTGYSIQLYPNANQSSELLRANEILTIPAEDGASLLVASAPAGVEMIRVIASTAPFVHLMEDPRRPSGPFEVIDGGAGVVARDLQQQVTTHRGDIAIADAFLTTIDHPQSLASDLSIPLPAPAFTNPSSPLLAIDRSEYRIGDKLRLAVTSSDDCYLWVVNVSTDGSARLLFPNRLVHANHLRVGQTVIVSGPPSPVEVVAAGPQGNEDIYAICGRYNAPPWEFVASISELFPSPSTDADVGSELTDKEVDIRSHFGWSKATIVVKAVD